MFFLHLAAEASSGRRKEKHNFEISQLELRDEAESCFSCCVLAESGQKKKDANDAHVKKAMQITCAKKMKHIGVYEENLQHL